MSKQRVPKLLSAKLRRLGACRPAIRWGNGQQPYRAWRACQRGDWLQWLLYELALLDEGSDAYCILRDVEYRTGFRPWLESTRARKERHAASAEAARLIRRMVPWRVVRDRAIKMGLLEPKQKRSKKR